jgi:hypothetical protein
LTVPNVENNFLWRACHDILPTRNNLIGRKIVEDLLCPICGLESETPFHILWACPSGWGVNWKKIQKCSFHGPAFIHVLEEVVYHGSEEERKLFAGISHQLWLRRNEMLNEGTFTHPTLLVQKVKQSTTEYEKAAANTKGHDRETIRSAEVEKWKEPIAGRLKADWDAAPNTKDGRMGMGVALRDNKGRVKAAKYSFRHGGFDPTTAEALATTHALHFCISLGVQHISVEEMQKV